MSDEVGQADAVYQYLTFGPDGVPLQHGPGWLGSYNCYIHGYDPVPDTVYRLCFECGHCYSTPEDLRTAYRLALEIINSQSFSLGIRDGDRVDPFIVPAAEDIVFCQECLHDF